MERVADYRECIKRLLRERERIVQAVLYCSHEIRCLHQFASINRRRLDT